MKWYVDIIESEAGWGQKIDETKEFKSKKSADRFITKFNDDKSLKKKVPSFYMYASIPYQRA